MFITYNDIFPHQKILRNFNHSHKAIEISITILVENNIKMLYK